MIDNTVPLVDNTVPIIVSALIGLLAGAIGSLVAPWIHWGIEKRKFKRKSRIELITELRVYQIKNNLQNSEFLNSYNYLRIRPFLSTGLIDAIESKSLVYHINNQNVYSKHQALFIQELDLIERKWGLGLGKGKNRNKSFYDKDKGGGTVLIESLVGTDVTMRNKTKSNLEDTTL